MGLFPLLFRPVYLRIFRPLEYLERFGKAKWTPSIPTRIKDFPFSRRTPNRYISCWNRRMYHKYRGKILY